MNTHTHNTRNPIRIVMATVALVAAFAGAARAGDAPQVHVRYADLNVNTAAGATVLYQRIRRAAVEVCDVRNTRDLAVLDKVKVCTDHAVAEAVGAVNNPTLTGVYMSKMGGKAETRLAGTR
jgi:UrcA family protein